MSDDGSVGELVGYDWTEVFGYANGSKSRPVGIPEGSNVSSAPFDIADVKSVAGKVNGDNEGPDWVAFGELHDGRWLCISAGCDYTGWG